MKKIFLFIFLMVIFSFEVSAEACDSYDIKRLKELANGIEITYELQEPFPIDGGIIKDYYKLNVTGLTDELVMFDNDNDERYDLNTIFSDIKFRGGKYIFSIVSKECYRKLKTIVIKLPVYNLYSDGNFCSAKDTKKLGVCQEWVEDKITESEFDRAYLEYSKGIEKDTTNNKKIYFVILGVIVLVVFVVVISLIFRKRKERLL